MKKINSDILITLFLSLITISTLTGVYYLNLNEEEIIKDNYLKSDICYYALNGIKSDYHYHFQLNITINDKRIIIPENIGFEKNDQGETIFLHPIHTYDNSGRIHVETTKNATAELKFFFQIWDKKFTNTELLDYTTDSKHKINMKINGEETDTFEETILEPYIFIEIEYKELN